VELPQLAEFARLATPLARFGKVGRAASKQKVAGSSPAGRAIILNLIGKKGIRKTAVHPRSTAKSAEGRVLRAPEDLSFLSFFQTFRRLLPRIPASLCELSRKRNTYW
jgi:hypothetical protein